MSLEFEWDAAKAAANVRKHGVAFEAAAGAFADALSLTITDPPTRKERKSYEEDARQGRKRAPAS